MTDPTTDALYRVSMQVDRYTTSFPVKSWRQLGFEIGVYLQSFELPTAKLTIQLDIEPTTPTDPDREPPGDGDDTGREAAAEDREIVRRFGAGLRGEV